MYARADAVLIAPVINFSRGQSSAFKHLSLLFVWGRYSTPGRIDARRLRHGGFWMMLCMAKVKSVLVRTQYGAVAWRRISGQRHS